MDQRPEFLILHENHLSLSDHINQPRPTLEVNDGVMITAPSIQAQRMFAMDPIFKGHLLLMKVVRPFYSLRNGAVVPEELQLVEDHPISML